MAKAAEWRVADDRTCPGGRFRRNHSRVQLDADVRRPSKLAIAKPGCAGGSPFSWPGKDPRGRSRRSLGNQLICGHSNLSSVEECEDPTRRVVEFCSPLSFSWFPSECRNSSYEYGAEASLRDQNCFDGNGYAHCSWTAWECRFAVWPSGHAQGAEIRGRLVVA
jgi:hypothetical protein